MNKETYIKMTQPFRDNAKIGGAIHILNKFFTYLIFLSYPILLLYLLINRSPMLYRAIIVPLDSFIILSVFRYIVNRPRPYEKFEVAPVIEKATKGKSFPSRHVFSAFVITMTFLYVFPFSGGYMVLVSFFMIVSLGLAAIRVLSGVHFISDVLVGMLVGIAAGILGYFLI